MRGPVLSLLAGGLLLSAGCASMKVQDQLEKLKEAVEGYNQAFRWKNYERAAQYLPVEHRGAFVAAYDDDEKSLQMEDYNVSRVDLISEEAATVSVRVRFLLLPSVVVENRTLTQHWQKIEGAWILETEENSIRKLDFGTKPELPPEKPDSKDPYEVEVEAPGDGDSEAREESSGEPGWE